MGSKELPKLKSLSSLKDRINEKGMSKECEIMNIYEDLMERCVYARDEMNYALDRGETIFPLKGELPDDCLERRYGRWCIIDKQVMKFARKIYKSRHS